MGADMQEGGRTAVVTGAGSGIGKAITAGLVAAGFRVDMAGRRQVTLDEAGADISREPGRLLTVPTDIGDPGAVDRLFERLTRKFGQLDPLVNNADANMPGVPGV